MAIDPTTIFSKKGISVEQAFNICLIFYNRLWPSIEPKLHDLDHDAAVVHDLFFTSTCSGFECSGEWMEAVFRITHVPKSEQKNRLLLTEEEVFLCTIEFCKVCKDSFNWDLKYILYLLDAMQSDFQKHSFEWSLWRQAVERSYIKTFFHIDWNSEL